MGLCLFLLLLGVWWLGRGEGVDVHVIVISSSLLMGRAA